MIKLSNTQAIVVTLEWNKTLKWNQKPYESHFNTCTYYMSTGQLIKGIKPGWVNNDFFPDSVFATIGFYV